MTEAVTAIVYNYRGQETLAENLTDTDIQYFLEWHLNNEGYDNGTENKPILILMNMMNMEENGLISKMFTKRWRTYMEEK